MHQNYTYIGICTQSSFRSRKPGGTHHTRRINLEEHIRVASPTKINLEEPVRVASPTRINLEEQVRVRPAQPGYTHFAWAGGTCPRFAWAGGTFFPVVLLYCVSFWFWEEIGFGCTYYYVLGVPYSCGVVKVYLVLAGNSIWCYVRT